MGFLRSYIFQLKIKLQHSINNIFSVLRNNLFLLVIDILFAFLGTINILFILLLILYNIYLFKISKDFFKVSIIFLLLFYTLYIMNILLIRDYSLDSFEGTITNIVYKEDYNQITVVNGFKKVLVNHYYNEYCNYNIGDIVKVSGENIKMEHNRVPLMFDYKEYLISKRYISIISCSDVFYEEKINIYYLKRILFNYVNNFSNETKPFIFSLVLGDSSLLEDEITEGIKVNGISHLFAISGLHINLIIMWLNKIIDKINIKRKRTLLNIILFTYLFITGFSFSVLRAVLMNYLLQLNKYYKLRFSSLDICSFSFALIVSLLPFSIFNIGFQLSYLVTFIIIIFNNVLTKYIGLKQSFVLGIISFIGTIPFSVNINNYINLLSPIVNILFVYYITVVILPFSFIVLFIPLLDNVYIYLIKLFIISNDFISSNISIIIDLPNFNIYEIVIYYLLIIILFNVYKKRNLFKKVLSIFIIFIFCYYNKANLNLYNEVVFLDLKDGEATLINSAFNNYTILIDTGDGTGDVVTNYLKKKGIRKLDYLILTHNHQDHNGEADLILREIDVDNIIVSSVDNSKYSNYGKTTKVKSGDSIDVGNITLEILSPNKKNSDENNNSLVIYTELGDLKYLFTGDASCNILDNINISVDVIKGGHHGSKTSSSYNLYNNCNPKYVILQTGRIKKYNFPHSETIELLERLNKKIYRTDQNYTITIFYTSFFSYFQCLNE